MALVANCCRSNVSRGAGLQGRWNLSLSTSTIRPLAQDTIHHPSCSAPSSGGHPDQSPILQHTEQHHTAMKRSRPTHDVDGPFTGLLSCKKRRLRRELITSRLSQPYSLPATHILNRETAGGGEVFLRRAAAAASSRAPDAGYPYGALGIIGGAGHMSANKVVGRGPAEIVRRAAMLNRIRLRVCDEAGERSGTVIGVDELKVSPEASLMPGSAGVKVGEETADTFAPRRRETTFYFTPDSDTAANTPGDAGSRPTPSKYLRSPELRAARVNITRPLDGDQGDDDSLSFPNNDYIEDLADVEEVYADFGVLFGGTGENEDQGHDRGPVSDVLHAAEHMEDYMDDLDGIPTRAR